MWSRRRTVALIPACMVEDSPDGPPSRIDASVGLIEDVARGYGLPRAQCADPPCAQPGGSVGKSSASTPISRLTLSFSSVAAPAPHRAVMSEDREQPDQKRTRRAPRGCRKERLRTA